MWYLGKTLPIDVSASRSLFFFIGAVAKFFFECLHTTHVKRTHTGTLNYESGPENENAQVAWPHVGTQESEILPKKFTINIFKLDLHFFHLYEYIKNITKILGTWKIYFWPLQLAHYQFYKNAPESGEKLG